MLLNFQLPVYEVRAFLSIEKENGKTFIQTIYKKYILDDRNYPGDYGDRRIQLFMDKDKPLPLYPLRKRISTIPQLLNSKATHFITEQGELVTYKKSRYYNIVCKRVMSCTRIYNGKYHCYVAGVAHPFITSQPYEFLSLIEFKNSLMLFDVHLEQPEKIRYRVKI